MHLNFDQRAKTSTSTTFCSSAEGYVDCILYFFVILCRVDTLRPQVIMCLIFTHVLTYVVCTLEINGSRLFKMHNDLYVHYFEFWFYWRAENTY